MPSSLSAAFEKIFNRRRVAFQLKVEILMEGLLLLPIAMLLFMWLMMYLGMIGK